MIAVYANIIAGVLANEKIKSFVGCLWRGRAEVEKGGGDKGVEGREEGQDAEVIVDKWLREQSRGGG